MDQLEQLIDKVTGPATGWLGALNDWAYTYILLAALIFVGLFLTIRLGGVQFRFFGQMLKVLRKSRQSAEGGISSFQAFAMGMATRIGIGNIVGVALAIILGGVGSLFWMWAVAALGMATAFTEATLAQLFKTKHAGNTFRGGPAFYISKGLGSKTFAVIFAVAMIFCMVVAMPMIQANAIAGVLLGSHGVSRVYSAILIGVLLALTLLAGVRGVAKVTEWLSPLMAIMYLLIAIVVMVLNLPALGTFIKDVFLSAFDLRSSMAGISGGILAAMVNGVRRGLFSNEAGMGTNPNAAATATVSHPVSQGLVQSFGVFLDTMLVCTATGFILVAGGVLKPGLTDADAASLTTHAVLNTLGSWMAVPMTVMIFVFGFSSILGAFAYAEANLVFLKFGRVADYVARTVMVLCGALGSILALKFAWALLDTAMFIVTILNLVALLGLSKWVKAALDDYRRQLRGGITEPVFDPECVKLPDISRLESWRVGVAPAYKKSSVKAKR